VLNIAAKCSDLAAKMPENDRKNLQKSTFFSYFCAKNKKSNKNNGFPEILNK